jgi:squalene monooxygenase
MPLIHESPTVAVVAQPDLFEQRREEHHDCDIVIVGAGIVGCALAVALGKQGRSVILLEKSLKEPKRIVGELLQPGGVMALKKLGLRGKHVKPNFTTTPCITAAEEIIADYYCCCCC